MDWSEALEIIVARTRHERFRWLCSDANPEADQRDGYRATMIEQATGEHAAAAPQPADPWLPLIRACEHHNPGCCAHPAAFCSLFARDVSRDDCVACLTGRGIVP